jgi:hypothetical protein
MVLFQAKTHISSFYYQIINKTTTSQVFSFFVCLIADSLNTLKDVLCDPKFWNIKTFGLNHHL